MKKLKQLTIAVILFLGLVPMSFGQAQLFGKWTANCPTERLDIATVQFCELCPMKIIDKTSLKILDFELNFDQKMVNLNIDNKVVSVPYKWNEATESIQLTYNNIFYSFKILTTNNPKLIILKNTDGNLMILNKV
jgi:hypothetical protein